MLKKEKKSLEINLKNILGNFMILLQSLKINLILIDKRFDYFHYVNKYNISSFIDVISCTLSTNIASRRKSFRTHLITYNILSKPTLWKCVNGIKVKGLQ